MERYMTVDDFALKYHVKKGTVYKWITQGKIPSFKVFGRTLFIESEINEFFRAKNGY